MFLSSGVGVGGGVVLQAEDGIRSLVRSRGLGDVYKRQLGDLGRGVLAVDRAESGAALGDLAGVPVGCLLYTSDAAGERSSVDLGGCRILKKKNNN